MKISFKLAETDSEINRAILNSLLPQTTTYMNKVVSYIKSNIAPIVSESILSAPEYESLTCGILKAELGIPDASIRVNEIINIWIRNIEVNYNPPKINNNQIKSSLTIKMIRADFRDVLGSTNAEIIHYNTGSIVPWLRWLLLEGTATLVDNYEVILGAHSRSRTGLAIMKKADNKSWSMPSEFAGTIDDNWITRAIKSAEPQITKLLERALDQ
jgi:hypothetical protein